MTVLRDLFMSLDTSWQQLFKEELTSDYLKELSSFLETEQKSEADIFPQKSSIFNAFNLTPLQNVKVVILGQDPYHGTGQAHGLSFSVPKGINIPPSLRNIYKEISSDLGLSIPTHGNLVSWANQGVLLLNATLTVRKKQPKSHYGKGWEKLTDFVIASLAKSSQPVAFLLWGKSAAEKEELILKEGEQPYLILKAPHPSPYSAHSGFLGCKHFSTANKWLKNNQIDPINWEIT